MKNWVSRRFSLKFLDRTEMGIEITTQKKLNTAQSQNHSIIDVKDLNRPQTQQQARI